MSDETTKKERAWLHPPSSKTEDLRGLSIVSTPIGNLRDITIRALDVLAGVDAVLCEDTRVTGKLLSYYGLSKKLLSYNDHNAARMRPVILERLAAGESLALVSDAGTPLVSDPGFKLVSDCFAAGHKVTSVPGANAPLTALQLSGLPSDKFCFLGFLPPKTGAREKILQAWKSVPAPLILFETAPRLLAALGSIHKVYGSRQVAVVRELTKMFEESRRGAVEELIAHYSAEGPPKGEIVIVIGAGDEEMTSAADLENLMAEALQNMGTKEAAAHVAAQTGRPKKELYELALKIARDAP